MEVDSINRPPPLVIVFNNRWRWCSGRFNFRLRRLELDYLRSHSCHVFYSVVVLIFFLSLRAIKTNHLLHFLLSYEIKCKIIVGGIFSNISIRSHDLVICLFVALVISCTYDLAISNNNWPCKLF